MKFKLLDDVGWRNIHVMGAAQGIRRNSVNSTQLGTIRPASVRFGAIRRDSARFGRLGAINQKGEMIVTELLKNSIEIY